MKQSVFSLIIMAFVAAFVVAGPSPAEAEELKIGYIVRSKLMSDTKVGQEARAELEKRLGEAQKGLDKKAAEIKEMQEDIQKRMMVLSDEEKKKVAEEHERQMRDAKRLQEDYQLQLRKAEAEVIERINQHLTKVIGDYGEANGYDLILDEAALLYASDKADITAAVAKASDKAK